jgi:basic membrane protein A and related proteins
MRIAIRYFLPGLAVAALATIAAGCGSGGKSSSSAGTTTGSSFTAALVSDIGKFNDRSFNQSQLEGLNKARRELGIKALPLQSNSTSDYVPNLATAVRRKANITIAAGFLLADTLETVAARYPDAKFAITDYCARGAAKTCITGSVLKSNHPNIMGLDYAANQSGCLVGYLAAEMAKKQGGKQIISAVGAIPVPAIIRYISGYIQGAKKANPKIKVIANYADDNTFSDQAKCKETALGQIQKGTQAIFQVAGGCGLGALSAAKEGKIWGIGVDADQLYLGSFMMTSALKTVDKAVSDLTKLAYAGNLATQRDYNYNLRNNGVGLGTVNPKISKAFVTKTKAVAKLIAAGKIKVKPTIKF